MKKSIPQRVQRSSTSRYNSYSGALQATANPVKHMAKLQFRHDFMILYLQKNAPTTLTFM
jgi:hypothetical protein